MKYIKIFIKPFMIKGDLDDMDTLGHDVFEKVISMAEAETLDWYPDEEGEEGDEDDSDY